MIKKSICKVKIVSIDELDYKELMVNFFSSEKYMLFCVVDKNGCYIGMISVGGFAWIIDQFELEYKFRVNNNLAPDIIQLDRQTISKISELYRTALGSCETEIAVEHIMPEDDKDIRNEYAPICEKLLQAGVHLIKVKVPNSVANEKQQHKAFKLYPTSQCFYSLEARPIIEPVLSKIRDDTHETLRRQFLAEESKKQEMKSKVSKDAKTENDSRIFFVGPCIVAGGIEEDENLIRNICKKELQKRGLFPEVITISVPRWTLDDISQLEAYDLTNRDIVIVIEDVNVLSGKSEDSDIDITPVFNSYREDKWLFYDIVLHTTIYGNRLIAEKIIEKIVPVLKGMKNTRKKILIHKTEKIMQLQKQEQSVISEFLDNCKNKIPRDSRNTGAIVMNANPFTKGHRYLVETAAKQVELLIVFVVEEDASYIPFKDRIRLVEEGVKDLHNVTVMPSGHYIISKITFKGYFKKEILQSSVIDASTDIRIFGEYIAKELRITKRFVGEEPIDQVTRQYNEQMKKQLPNYGVELVEIPRITFDDNVISASYVRELLKKGFFEEIKSYVPVSTYNYLIQSGEFLERREFLERSIRKRKKYKK